MPTTENYKRTAEIAHSQNNCKQEEKNAKAKQTPEDSSLIYKLISTLQAKQ